MSNEAPHPGGRPSKLTPELQEKLCGLLRQGVSRQAAAAAVNIGYATLREWVARGEERDPDRPPSEEFAAFAAALHAAEADFEAETLKELQALASGGEHPDWRGAAWVLERRFPDRWGSKVKQEVAVTGKDGGPLQVQQTQADLSKLSDAQLQRLARGEPLAAVLAGAGDPGAAPEGEGDT